MLISFTSIYFLQNDGGQNIQAEIYKMTVDKIFKQKS